MTLRLNIVSAVPRSVKRAEGLVTLSNFVGNDLHGFDVDHIYPF